MTNPLEGGCSTTSCSGPKGDPDGDRVSAGVQGVVGFAGSGSGGAEGMSESEADVRAVPGEFSSSTNALGGRFRFWRRNNAKNKNPRMKRTLNDSDEIHVGFVVQLPLLPLKFAGLKVDHGVMVVFSKHDHTGHKMFSLMMILHSLTSQGI